MEFELRIRAATVNELRRIIDALSDLPAGSLSISGRAPALEDEPEDEASEEASSQNSGSTRERGFRIFVGWAGKHHLNVRRSGTGESGTFIVHDGAGEWPVEVVCSRRPRISLRKGWAEPKNLVIAYVWVDDELVSLMRYQEVAELLEGAAFTNEGFYTKPLSPSRTQDLTRFRDRLDVFELAAVDTLMETGAFSDEEEALDYARENPFPGQPRTRTR